MDETKAKGLTSGVSSKFLTSSIISGQSESGGLVDVFEAGSNR